MGDLDRFQITEVMQSVVDTYANKEIKLNIPYKRFYLIPLFSDKYIKLIPPKYHINLLFYEIDKENLSHPINKKRLGTLIVDNLKEGLNIRDEWKLLNNI